MIHIHIYICMYSYFPKVPYFERSSPAACTVSRTRFNFLATMTIAACYIRLTIGTPSAPVRDLIPLGSRSACLLLLQPMSVYGLGFRERDRRAEEKTGVQLRRRPQVCSPEISCCMFIHMLAKPFVHCEYCCITAFMPAATVSKLLLPLLLLLVPTAPTATILPVESLRVSCLGGAPSICYSTSEKGPLVLEA